VTCSPTALDRDDARQPAAAIVRFDGLRSHLRAAPHRARPHTAGQRDLRHDPPETVEARRAGQGQHPAGERSPSPLPHISRRVASGRRPVRPRSRLAGVDTRRRPAALGGKPQGPSETDSQLSSNFPIAPRATRTRAPSSSAPKISPKPTRHWHDRARKAAKARRMVTGCPAGSTKMCERHRRREALLRRRRRSYDAPDRTAVDAPNRRSDVGGRVRCQEDDNIRDLLWRS
jgi:hypothetical protein